jgi:hypothetical protein
MFCFLFFGTYGTHICVPVCMFSQLFKGRNLIQIQSEPTLIPESAAVSLHRIEFFFFFFKFCTLYLVLIAKDKL